MNAPHRFFAALVVILSAVGVAAYGHADHGPSNAPKPAADELAAFEAAKPVFERHCFRCHTTTGRKAKRMALEHVTMDAYPFGGHHAAEAGQVVRDVLGSGTNGKATMPSDNPGAVKGDDLNKILAWATVFERRHASKIDATATRRRDEKNPR